MVDTNIIGRLISNIKGYLSDLKEIDVLDFCEYQKDIKTQRFVERTLQIAIESMFDIAHHIISDENYREPSSYADAFDVLQENNIITAEFLKTAKLIAQFRNKLVHYYEKIEPELVYSIAKDKRKDIIEFTRQVTIWIKNTDEKINSTLNT